MTIMNTLTISEIGTYNKAECTPKPPAERFHSLDALRAFALLLGVFFHSLMAYILPPGIWAVGTTAPSRILFWFVYYSHCFRMEAFFLLAGFFARLVIEKRGVSAFLRDRARRVLLVFVVALYPMKLLLSSEWITGGLKTGWLKLPPAVAQLPLWQLSIGGLRMESWSSINLTHLWFLYYLASISGLFVAARWLILRTARSASLSKTIDAGFRQAAASWFAPLFLTLCVTPMLAMMSGPDVDTPDKGLAWKCPVLLLYGLFFCLGWWLHRQTYLLGIMGRRWQVFLPLSLAISVIASIGVGLRISAGAWAAEHATALRWRSSL